MKNLLNLLSFFCVLSLLAISCGDDEDGENNCTTDPTITIQANIIGIWIIDGDDTETVSFNSDGTGSSSDMSFNFATSNEGKEYHNFGWIIEEDSTVVVTFDYSPDTPTVPFIISEDYTVLSNSCDEIAMDPGFSSNNRIVLTK